jgi:hypothetical protein
MKAGNTPSDWPTTWLRASLARTHSPDVEEFLENYWWRVMVGAALDGRRRQANAGNRDSTTGRRADLERSTEADRRGTKTPCRPGIVTGQAHRRRPRCRSVCPAAERGPFLNTLFDLQTAALRSQATQIRLSASASEPRDKAPRAIVEQQRDLENRQPRVCLSATAGQRVHYLRNGDG